MVGPWASFPSNSSGQDSRRCEDIPARPQALGGPWNLQSRRRRAELVLLPTRDPHAEC